MTRRVSALLLLSLVACAAPAAPPPQPLTVAEMPALDPNAVLNDIRTLSSDEFGGRAPGSPGEQMTVDYLVKQFHAAGAQPGNPDGT